MCCSLSWILTNVSSCISCCSGGRSTHRYKCWKAFNLWKLGKVNDIQVQPFASLICSKLWYALWIPTLKNCGNILQIQCEKYNDLSTEKKKVFFQSTNFTIKTFSFSGQRTFLRLVSHIGVGENLSSLCVFVKLLGWQATARCILSTLVYTQIAAVSTA